MDSEIYTHLDFFFFFPSLNERMIKLRHLHLKTWILIPGNKQEWNLFLMDMSVKNKFPSTTNI